MAHATPPVRPRAPRLSNLQLVLEKALRAAPEPRRYRDYAEVVARVLRRWHGDEALQVATLTVNVLQGPSERAITTYEAGLRVCFAQPVRGLELSPEKAREGGGCADGYRVPDAFEPIQLAAIEVPGECLNPPPNQ